MVDWNPWGALDGVEPLDPSVITEPSYNMPLATFTKEALPTLPKWEPITTSGGSGGKATTQDVLGVQHDIGQQIRSVAAKLRYLGPIFGNTKVGARIGILREKGGYVYILGLLGIGEIEEIQQVEVGGRVVTTGDIESDPDYLGDWALAATWTALGGLPYDCQVGDIFKYNSIYYTCQQAFTVTSYTSPYLPSAGGAYAGYFDLPITGATTYTYLGTDTQDVDPLMVELLGSENWDENLRSVTIDGEAYNIPYFTIKFPISTNVVDYLEAGAIVKGNLLYDPRTNTTEYRENPALALAAFISSTLWGMGAEVDWDSVEAAADHCDEEFTDGERIRLNEALSTDKPQAVTTWLEILRTYAMVGLYYQDGKYYFIPDKARASSGSIQFPPVATALPMLSLPEITNPLTAPNNVLIRWTYASGWVSASTEVATAAVEAGADLPYQAEYRLPGISTEEEAERYANYQLARAQQQRLSIKFVMPDAGLLVTPGTRWLLKAPNLPEAGMDVIVTESNESQLGYFSITAIPYDESVYEVPA